MQLKVPQLAEEVGKMAEGRLFDGYGDDGNLARLRQTTERIRHGVCFLPLAGEKSLKMNNDPDGNEKRQRSHKQTSK